MLIKNWSHLVFVSSSRVMVLKLSKKVHFFSENSVKAIYIEVSERSCFTLSENGIVYYAITLWLTVLEILGFEVEEFF